jgi:ankyrin repeat protein
MVQNTCEDIFEAVRRGDVECVRELLRRGVNPNIRDIYVRGGSTTPFNIGLYLKRGGVKEGGLSKSGGYCCSGETPLHVASRRGHVEIVKLLLEHGADPNIRDMYGETPLHDAAYWGHADVVKLLLEHGADLSAKNKYGETPLFLAIHSEYGTEVAKLLLERGADPNVRSKRMLYGRRTPLHYAVLGGDVELARLLLEKGANPNAKDEYGETPLHIAVVRGDLQMAKLLLQYGADPNARDKWGETPLDDVQNFIELAIEDGEDPQKVVKTAKEMTKLLRKYGARDASPHLLRYLEGSPKSAAKVSAIQPELSTARKTVASRPRRKKSRKSIPT